MFIHKALHNISSIAKSCFCTCKHLRIRPLYIYIVIFSIDTSQDQVKYHTIAPVNGITLKLFQY